MAPKDFEAHRENCVDARLHASELKVGALLALIEKAQVWICGEDCGGGNHRSMCLELQAAFAEKSVGAPLTAQKIGTPLNRKCGCGAEITPGGHLCGYWPGATGGRQT